jgi:adenylate kinase
MALSLGQSNPMLRVHVVWAGFIFGNGEQNDIFYEFFRRAWVSLHPDLAALPVIEKGNNTLPTVHVTDLTNSIDLILTEGQNFKNTLFAVDQSCSQTQKDIMIAISEGIGSGATQEVKISDVVEEPWCEFLQVNVKLVASPCLANGFTWKCPTGINKDTMKMLNDEFNFFRGLFPLKVFITGPPCSGKTYAAQKLCEQYGVPHITIKDIVNMGMALTNEYG